MNDKIYKIFRKGDKMWQNNLLDTKFAKILKNEDKK